jgi:hypothetical protein
MNNFQYLDSNELVMMLQVLQASPQMWAFIDESIVNELADAGLFNTDEYRITGKAREILARSPAA